MKKFKSFSMIEVLASMIISSVIISIAYSVYAYTYSGFSRFTGAKKEMSRYFQLSSILNQEFETAKKVIKENTREIEMQFADKKINYSFDDEYVIRTMDQIEDTFFLNVTEVEMNTLGTQSNKTTVEYLKVTIKDEGGDKSLSFYKNYGAIIKMED